MTLKIDINELDGNTNDRFEVNCEDIKPFRVYGDMTIEDLISHIKKARKEVSKKALIKSKGQREMAKNFSQVP